MGLRLVEMSLAEVMADAELQASWDELAAADPCSSYFQTADWVASWWETVAAEPPGVVGTVWDGAHLSGLFPLARVDQPITGRLPVRTRLLTNAGSGIGTDHAGWLAERGAEALLADWTTDQGALVLRGVPLKLGEAVGGRLMSTTRCPLLGIDGAERVISSKLAKTLRNARRRLDREGVTFTFRQPGDVTVADLEELYRLHDLRRTSAGDTPVFDDDRRAFHARLLDKGTGPNGTAVVVATRGDDVLGVLYGFVWQTTFSYYQIGWDPELRQLSLGSVLVQEAIEACAGSGLERFDFLRGPESYKYRFGASDVVEGTFAVGRSIGLTVMEAAERLRSMRSEEE